MTTATAGFIVYDGDTVVAKDVSRDDVIEYFGRWYA